MGIRIGVISDTHGLMRPAALSALAGVDLIIHAGDVGTPQILKTLESIAPVIAVSGNCDTGELAQSLPSITAFEAEQVLIKVVHNVKDLAECQVREGQSVVIVSGHSHRPLIRQNGTILHINPGSAGRRRFRLPVSLALLEVADGCPHASIVMLEQDV